jgi:tetratricopeptide (TPR) repeat protein
VLKITFTYSISSATNEVDKAEVGMGAALEVLKFKRFIMSRFFRYFLWIVLGSNILWYFFGSIWPYYWNMLASLLIPFGVCLITSRSTDEAASCLCGWGREDTSQQDWLAGEMNKIRLLKRQRNFDKAFALVNDLLDKVPNLPEALYLKGHLLWEGFKNPWAAESYFRRVIELTEDNQPVHRWASSCLSGLYSKVSY